MNAPQAWSLDGCARLTVEEDDEAGRRERLHAWLIANGASFAAVAIDDCDGRRGVRAGADLPQGTEVARIPERLFLTTEMAKRSPLGQRIASRGLTLKLRTVLSLHLLELRREGGFWEPYIDSLPRSFAGHPVGFGTLELMALDAMSVIGASAAAARSTYRAELTSAAEVLAEEGFAAADFQWAYCCVHTRFYDLFGDSSVHALIPFADMLNHASEPATKGRRTQSGDYMIASLRDTANGHEITASYGQRANASLFADYGFILDHNPFDVAGLFMGDRFSAVGRTYANPALREVFQALRMSTPIELRRLRATSGDGPYDAEHEYRVLDAIHSACQATLSQRLRCDRLEGSSADAPTDDEPAAALRRAVASENDVLWRLVTMTQTAGRVLRDGGADADDRALLAHIDPDYAAAISPLIDTQGEPA